MAKRSRKHIASRGAPATPGSLTSTSTPVGASRLSGKKLWCFRLLALFVVPLVFAGLLELILRMTGQGYPTDFLRPMSQGGRQLFVQNNQFGWRFFGPRLARHPYPFATTPKPAPDTVRIIVFGESAAKGDPDPHFGLPRMLEATLSLRHPGVRFEVINAAMTAINSHVVLPVARDCTKLNSDIWVIYMGNNEVVGPFGAGTVFGPKTPPLALIRSALALETMRMGQLLDSALEGVRKSPIEIPEWGGMEMFLNQQVRADDPRMDGVYRHFERNLADIIRLGRRHGSRIVLSTVAVNLKDCAPFASAHRAGLSAEDQSKWNEWYQLGVQAQEEGKHEVAAENFREATRLDDAFAELRFRQGQCALALGQTVDAQALFQAARDFDTLRFRCDTRLNEIIRRTASNPEGEGILLADAERALAESSQYGLPGENFFYEHVHFTFNGNHLLARMIAEQVEKLLDSRLAPYRDAKRQWPTPTECARRLAWTDWSQLAGWKGVLPRFRNPPFNGQFDHASRMQRVHAVLSALSAVTEPVGISNALATCETAAASAPNDPALQAQLVTLRQTAGDHAGATIAARRRLELLPGDSEGWSQLGLLLARQQQFADAIQAFEHAVQLDSQDVASLEHKAQSLAALGRQEEALRAFRQGLRLKPRLGVAWLHQGQLLERMGRTSEAADCYQKALANAGSSLSGTVEIAGFCQSRGWYEAAATNYIAAINWDSSNAKLHVGAGQNLAALGRLAEASHYSGEAVRLAPDFAEARLLHGLVLGRQGRILEATEQFREALRLKPNQLDARLNLAIALADRSPTEALGHLEVVLRQNPTNLAAMKLAQQLRLKLGNPQR